MRQKITQERRSHIMASIKGRNTKPEMAVRQFLHRSGLRYGLHAKDLPGSPDLVFRSRRTVLFVHGCFWHRCPHCSVGRQEVRTNTKYWVPKFERNKSRDSTAQTALRASGWKVLVVWECQATSPKFLENIAAGLRQQAVTREPTYSKASRPRAMPRQPAAARE